jgi:hypothetical protein
VPKVPRRFGAENSSASSFDRLGPANHRAPAESLKSAPESFRFSVIVELRLVRPRGRAMKRVLVATDTGQLMWSSTDCGRVGDNYTYDDLTWIFPVYSKGIEVVVVFPSEVPSSVVSPSSPQWLFWLLFSHLTQFTF